MSWSLCWPLGSLRWIRCGSQSCRVKKGRWELTLKCLLWPGLYTLYFWPTTNHLTVGQKNIISHLWWQDIPTYRKSSWFNVGYSRTQSEGVFQWSLWVQKESLGPPEQVGIIYEKFKSSRMLSVWATYTYKCVAVHSLTIDISMRFSIRYPKENPNQACSLCSVLILQIPWNKAWEP